MGMISGVMLGFLGYLDWGGGLLVSSRLVVGVQRF